MVRFVTTDSFLKVFSTYNLKTKVATLLTSDKFDNDSIIYITDASKGNWVYVKGHLYGEEDSTNVSWTQEQQSGTKIASITIDGVSTDVYAPLATEIGHTYNVQNDSLAEGVDSSKGNLNEAFGTRSHAEGVETKALGEYSHTEGSETKTFGSCAHAEGYASIAQGSYSNTSGKKTLSIGLSSHAEGMGEDSITESDSNLVFVEIISHSILENKTEIKVEANEYIESIKNSIIKFKGEYGYVKDITYPDNNYNILVLTGYISGTVNPNDNKIYNVIGRFASAIGVGSHSEGFYTTASGDGSHAEGLYTKALGDCSHSEGFYTTASGDGSYSEGFLTTASGDGSHSKGYLTTASGDGSHAEGGWSVSSGYISHAEGVAVIALGTGTHAEGYASIAQGAFSNVSGVNTISIGLGSHAEGICLDDRLETVTSIEVIDYTPDQSSKFANITYITVVKSAETDTLKGKVIKCNNVYGYVRDIVSTDVPTQVMLILDGHEDSVEASVHEMPHDNKIYIVNNFSAAIGDGSHVEGTGTLAKGFCEHAEGSFNKSNESIYYYEQMFVDLGLSVKWAKYNVNSNPDQTAKSWYGDYFAWGETTKKSTYNWSTYKYGNASVSIENLSKYNKTDGRILLDFEDDAASYLSDNIYRLPTEKEIIELATLPNKWVTNFNGISGLNGVVFTKTQEELSEAFDEDTMLFIPAAGYYGKNQEYESTVGDDGIVVPIWGKFRLTGSDENTAIAGALVISEGTNGNTVLYSFPRYAGMPIRAVYDNLYTQHSVGIGINESDRKNAEEILNNGNIYVKYVGNYDGTNVQLSKSLQQVINNKADRSELLNKADFESGEMDHLDLKAWYTGQYDDYGNYIPEYSAESCIWNKIGDFITCCYKNLVIYEGPNDLHRWTQMYYSLPYNCSEPAHGLVKGGHSNQALYWNVISDLDGTGVSVLCITPLYDNTYLYYDDETSITITYKFTND